MPRDLTRQSGNPTSWIHDNYQELMGIQDPEELAQHVLENITPMVGNGISQQNFAKMRQTLMMAARKGIHEVQKYLSNYMLRGAGLGVEDNEQLALASMVCEDCEVVRLNLKQTYLKRLVESNSRFKVKVLSESQQFI